MSVRTARTVRTVKIKTVGTVTIVRTRVVMSKASSTVMSDVYREEYSA